MAIHCKNDEEKKALLEEAEKLGYKWNNNCVPTNCRMVEIQENGDTYIFDIDDIKHVRYTLR